MLVQVTDKSIRVTHYGATKTVSFAGTRMGMDAGVRRSAYRVAMRWASMTGTSDACASAAWRSLGLGRLPAPSKLSEEDWLDILEGLDAAISDLVNSPQSKFYIHG